MQISNNYLAGVNVAQPGAAPPAGEAVRKSDPQASPAPDVSTHTPSPELQRLVDIVRQQPEVRQDLLQRVAQRLANGDYFTPEAAAQTADALLKSAD